MTIFFRRRTTRTERDKCESCNELRSGVKSLKQRNVSEKNGYLSFPLKYPVPSSVMIFAETELTIICARHSADVPEFHSLHLISPKITFNYN